MYLYFADQRVENLDSLPAVGSGTVITDKGEEVSSDLVVKATGLHINNDAYSNTDLGELISAAISLSFLERCFRLHIFM